MAPDEESQPLDEVGVFPVADGVRCELERRVSSALVGAGVASCDSRVTSSPPIAPWQCGQVLDAGSSSAAHVGQETTLARTAILAYTDGCALMPGVTTVEIPNRSLFRQPEVCEIAQVQSYVLRSWEAEFPDLGVSKTEGGPRVYRRADLERVLRLKHLLFVEGLTLAGARRKLLEEQPAAAAAAEVVALDELLGSDARERILQVKQGLRELATLLAKIPGGAEHEFELQRPGAVAPKKKKAAAKKKKKK